MVDSRGVASSRTKPSVVRRMESKLEACQHQSKVCFCDVCIDVLSSVEPRGSCKKLQERILHLTELASKIIKQPEKNNQTEEELSRQAWESRE